LLRQSHVGEFDFTQIAGGDRLASRRPSAEVRQFHVEQRPLESIHPKIAADYVVIITAIGAVYADMPRARVNLLPPRDERAAFAAASEIFSGIKTKRADVTDDSDGVPL